MGSSSSSLSPTHAENKANARVLVVGGGFAGAHCCRRLSKLGIDFVLVDQKSFFYHHLASVRAVVTPEMTKDLIFDYKETFGKRFVQGNVVAVDLGSKTAKLRDGQEIRFTKVVFATGAQCPFPGNTEQTEREALLKEMQEAGDDLKDAETVVICGGGAVGAELAGEIRDVYPAKTVIIVHSRAGLASDSMGQKFQDRIKGICDSRKIDLRLGVRVLNLADLTANKRVAQTIKLNDDSEIEADYVFVCIGMKTTTGLTSTLFDLNERGQIRVQPDLRVVGQEEAYAIGDCCDFDQEKMAAHAEDHGKLVADNINLALAGKEGKVYVPRFTGMVVTMGKYDGTGIFNGWCIPAFAVSMLKGKTAMFLDKTQALMSPIAYPEESKL